MNYGEEEDLTYLTFIHLDFGKFDSKVDKGIFLGYSYTSKAYRVFNSRTLVVEDFIHILSKLEEDFSNLQIGSSNKSVDALEPSNTRAIEQSTNITRIGNLSPIILKTSSWEINVRNIEEVLKEDDWIVAMEEDQFTRNNVLKLVPKPEHNSIMGTRWLDENGKVVRNKARLVAQGYNQQEGIDFTETFTLVAKFEAIRILLAFSTYKDINLFQMDVKSSFLNCFIEEEAFVKQPPVLNKHLILSMTNLAIFSYQMENKDFIMFQIYVDDIIFCVTNECLCKNFSDFMQSKFKMSMIRELKFFLGLQVKQKDNGIWIH
ncbi:Copia protein, partial [Mucuna pruriens]